MRKIKKKRKTFSERFRINIGTCSFGMDEEFYFPDRREAKQLKYILQEIETRIKHDPFLSIIRAKRDL